MSWYSSPESVLPNEIPLILADKDAKIFFPTQYNIVLEKARGLISFNLNEQRRLNPIAFVRPSFEQALKLNIWMYNSATFVVDFDANRVGKTACSVFNALLYLLPTDPAWPIFQPYIDHLGRLIKVYPRPPLILLKANPVTPPPNYDPNKDILFDIASYLANPLSECECWDTISLSFIRAHPSRYISSNTDLNKRGLKPHPSHLSSAFPLPALTKNSYENKPLTIWHGAPTLAVAENTVWAEWEKWIPEAFVLSKKLYDKKIELQVTNKRSARADVVIQLKTYESADTAWASSAVSGILLTEGVPRAIIDEVKQRFANPAFGHWDYTPTESRNVGRKAAIAYDVFTGKEELPLKAHVFSGYGMRDTPIHIMDKDKHDDLIRNWAGKEAGKARIDGNFFTSSPRVLELSPLNVLTITFQEFQQTEWGRDSLLYRAIDPGFRHVTACCWAALTRTNDWVIFRFYAKSNTTINERISDIANLSRSQIVPTSDKLFKEVYGNEIYPVTFIDHHTFKTDELTGLPFAYNYIRNGLMVRASITLGPKERAQITNNKLKPVLTKAHPITKRTGAPKIYFLINEIGVADAYEKLDNVFWKDYVSGERAGSPREEVQDADDDEFDAFTYLTASSLQYQEQKSKNSSRTTTPHIKTILTPASYANSSQSSILTTPIRSNGVTAGQFGG